jgi:agmatinase
VAQEGLVDASSSWHIGVRGFTYCSGVLEHARGLGFRVITIEDLLRRGFAQTVPECSDTVAGRPAYLCWDMDAVDPSVAPGVCTPACGGLTAREGIELLRSLSGLNIVAMDFNTVSPAQDVNGMAAQLCSHMIMEALVLLAANLGLLPD